MGEIIYGVVVFISTLVGAIAGIGGGVIIKPCFDMLGMHSVETIAFLSCCAVLCMSLYATTKHIRGAHTFDYRMVLLIAVGSALGGVIGSHAFQLFLSLYSSNIVQAIQSILLALLLLMVLLNIVCSFKTYRINNGWIIFCIGLSLGAISSFIGIGGGPANVAVFVFFFSCTLKQAVVYSLATIVCAQSATLATIAWTSGFGQFDLSLLWYIIPTALLGGIIGTKLQQKMRENTISIVFNSSVFVILCVSIFNAINACI